MVIPDYSIGFTQVEVEEIFTAAKAELTKMVASYTESGTQVNKRREADINARIAACQKALQAMDPTTYSTPHRTLVTAVLPRLPR